MPHLVLRPFTPAFVHRGHLAQGRSEYLCWLQVCNLLVSRLLWIRLWTGVGNFCGQLVGSSGTEFRGDLPEVGLPVLLGQKWGSAECG